MKRLLLFALAAMMFAACSKDAINEQTGIQPIVDEAPETLTVGFEDDETRIQLNEAQKTVWTEGDLVSVFYRSDANQKWQYTGETGARTADLKRVSTPEATVSLSDIVVVYPYNENYYINPRTCNVQATLPAVQTYLEDSYGLDGNIMISQSEYNNISLKNVCGWLKLQLTGDGEKVKSVTVRGNDGEQVAGELYINSVDATAILASEAGDVVEDEGENATGGAGANLIFENTVLTEVTLDCGEGVELGAEATAFYVALPPQTFAKGFTVEVEATDGHIMAKSTDKAITIERNHIQPMTAFDFAPSYPLSNEIFYTASEQVTPHRLDDIDATFISSSWDAETGFGVMLFDGNITKLGAEAFSWRSALTSVIIPEGVTTLDTGAFFQCVNMSSVHLPSTLTTIGYEAFYECRSLTNVTIPDGVTTIGDGAFCGCSSLTSVTIPDSVTTIESWAFSYCNSLMSVTTGNGVTAIGEGVFSNCEDLAEFKGKFAADGGRCLIKDDAIIAYANASGTEYTIPDGVTSMEKSAFRGCNDLAEVTIPSSVTSINVHVFLDCNGLVEVYCKSATPPSAIFYSNYWNAFPSDKNLQKIYVPIGSVEAYKTAEGWSNYKECIFEMEGPKLANNEIWYTNGSTIEATIPYKSEAFGDATIQSNNYDTEKERWVITFDKDITEIENYAFQSCKDLTSITIPNSVIKIGDYSFRYCGGLKNVTIPDSIITIGAYAFNECKLLDTIIIGSGVETIGKNAFADGGLLNVYCKATTPPALAYHVTSGYMDDFYGFTYTIYDYVFPKNDTLKIYVPSSSYNLYTSYTSTQNGKIAQTNWYSFKDNIYEYASL